MTMRPHGRPLHPLLRDTAHGGWCTESAARWPTDSATAAAPALWESMLGGRRVPFPSTDRREAALRKGKRCAGTS
jgi:hypothetical protein